jgi:RES domain-containing protein
VKIAAWRLVRAEISDRAFDGEGARLYGGRWNPPGMAAVYAAGTRSLAALEVLVHLPKPLRAAAFTLHRIEFEESAVETIPAGEVPGDWTLFPPPASTQNAGRAWLARAERPVLRVPSVVLPEESNYVLSPRHPGFAALAQFRERFFFFDPRLG